MRAGIFGSARVASGATYRAAVLADSPFCYFPLDDASTPTDVMGNVTPSAVAGVTFGASGIGDGATAASFDGGAAGRGIGLDVPNPSTGYTVEFIAQPTNVLAARNLVGGALFRVRHRSSGAAEAWVTVGATASWIAAGDTAVGTHHWALVWDGTTATLYKDGASVLSGAKGGPTLAAPHIIIGSDDTADNTFLGVMAGFAFYTHALTPAQILAHAQLAGAA